MFDFPLVVLLRTVAALWIPLDIQLRCAQRTPRDFVNSRFCLQALSVAFSFEDLGSPSLNVRFSSSRAFEDRGSTLDPIGHPVALRAQVATCLCEFSFLFAGLECRLQS